MRGVRAGLNVKGVAWDSHVPTTPLRFKPRARPRSVELLLLDFGESIKALSEYLGHADPGFTLHTYTHLMPSSAEPARRAVDVVLSLAHDEGPASHPRTGTPGLLRLMAC